jgi:hypothetical protein
MQITNHYGVLPFSIRPSRWIGLMGYKQLDALWAVVLPDGPDFPPAFVPSGHHQVPIAI